MITVLKEGEGGAKLGDHSRNYGMSDATYYNWKARYAGLTVAEQAPDNRALKDLLSRNF